MTKKEMNLLKVVEKVAHYQIEKKINADLPFCISIYHQPKRPKKHI